MRRRQLNKKQISIIAAIFLILLCALSGGLLARYVSSNQKRAEMVSSAFHFTGEYLEETAGTYTITSWGNQGIEIPVYNYEKTNPALVSEVDITYQVSVNGAWECANIMNGNIVVTGSADHVYEMKATGNAVAHMLYFQPKTGDDGEILEEASEPFTVTVTTTKPYKKVLQVTVDPNRKIEPEYTFTDKGNYDELVIKTNDWNGQITVKWDDAEFAPDNQSPEVSAMSDWVNNGTESRGDFYAAAHSVYTLIFFETMAKDHATKDGMGMTIQIGGGQ